jgi:hypothetical protein
VTDYDRDNIALAFLVVALLIFMSFVGGVYLAVGEVVDHYYAVDMAAAPKQ